MHLSVSQRRDRLLEEDFFESFFDRPEFDWDEAEDFFSRELETRLFPEDELDLVFESDERLFFILLPDPVEDFSCRDRFTSLRLGSLPLPRIRVEISFISSLVVPEAKTVVVDCLRLLELLGVRLVTVLDSSVSFCSKRVPRSTVRV